MKITLPYPISANRYWRHSGRAVYRSREAVAFKTECGFMAKLQGMKPLDGYIDVSVLLHPKLTAKGNASETRIDLDNSLKVALDALNGIAYLDDKQIVRLKAELAHPVKDGGLTVEVMAHE